MTKIWGGREGEGEHGFKDRTSAKIGEVQRPQVRQGRRFPRQVNSETGFVAQRNIDILPPRRRVENACKDCVLRGLLLDYLARVDVPNERDRQGFRARDRIGQPLQVLHPLHFMLWNTRDVNYGP